MKMKLIATVTLLLVSLSLLSCTTIVNYEIDISCEQFGENPNNISTFQIEIGDKVTVRLCSNPTTGFQWSYEMSGDTVLKEEGHDFEEPDSDVVGASGTDVWTFEGTAKGTTEVLMEYSKPWEDGTKKEWTYKMTVTVQ